jgi:hypothetical protein
MELVHQPPVMRVKLREIMENVIEKTLQSLSRDDWRLRTTKWSNKDLRPSSVTEHDACDRNATYGFKVLQVFDIIHLTLDQLKDDSTTEHISDEDPGKVQILRLTLVLLLGQTLPDFYGNQVGPIQLGCRSLAHCGLEGSQLGHSLEACDRFDGFHEVVRVRVSISRLMINGLEKDGILLQMLGWSIQ